MAKIDASFLFRGPGLLVLILLGAVGLSAAAGAALIHSITHPPKTGEAIDPSDLMLTTEDVRFPADDGEMISGWFVTGRPDGTVIILCHDLGGSRLSVMNTAVALNHAGYPLLMIDFRQNGRNAMGGSTLGIEERLDLLGALAYLRTRKDIRQNRFGAWGVGMGAYAVVLAALEDKSLVALALDSLYPDVPTHLDRLVSGKVPQELHALVPAVRLLYNPYFMTKLEKFSVRDRLQELAGRDILFVAGADSPDRLVEEKALYEALPEGPGGEKNFLQLNASGVSGLYAADRKKYDDTLVDFFTTRLDQDEGRREAPKKPFEVLEK